MNRKKVVTEGLNKHNVHERDIVGDHNLAKTQYLRFRLITIGDCNIIMIVSHLRDDLLASGHMTSASTIEHPFGPTGSIALQENYFLVLGIHFSMGPFMLVTRVFGTQIDQAIYSPKGPT